MSLRVLNARLNISWVSHVLQFISRLIRLIPAKYDKGGKYWHIYGVNLRQLFQPVSGTRRWSIKKLFSKIMQNSQLPTHVGVFSKWSFRPTTCHFTKKRLPNRHILVNLAKCSGTAFCRIPPGDCFSLLRNRKYISFTKGSI